MKRRRYNDAGEKEDIVSMQWHWCKRKEIELQCQLREFLSAASDRSLRRTGTQTGPLLATGEALAAAPLAARETYMWAYVWDFVSVNRMPTCVSERFVGLFRLIFLVSKSHNVVFIKCMITGFISELEVPLSVCFLRLCVGVSVYPFVFYLHRFVSVYPMTHSPLWEWRRALGGLCHAAVCSLPEAWRPLFDK